MDDSILLSDLDNGGESSDAYSPEPKVTKVKPASRKPAPSTKTGPPKKKKTTQTSLKSTKAPAAKKRPAPASDNENSDHERSNEDDSLLSNTPPSAKRQKTAPAPKKAVGKPLQQIDNESFGMDGSNNDMTSTSNPKKEQYQKLTQLEHILKRPDTYIGSVERTEKQMWVFNSSTNMMEHREVSYVPGLYKIFDEVLVNAADNKQRDKNMKEIKVTIDREKGEISVKNDGRGIPIEIHSAEKIWVPELIFGHLLTSSNYDDDEAKVTGGRNGYGAKLCNVYSTEFTLETVDSKSGKKYKQTWTSNMSKMQKAKITDNSGKDYTMVTFRPDFSKFGMKEIDDDFEALVKKRVYDMAGTCKGIRVYLNGDRIKASSFKQYMEMYTKAISAENNAAEDAPSKETQVILTDNPSERWEIGFAVSDGSFQQVSFVNSIATTSGGSHVNYIADQVIEKLMAIVKKRNKGGVTLKPAQIKNHIFLFVNCLIVNPAFTSQTKEQLTTKSSQFGSKCSVSEKFLKDIAKTEAVDNILHFAQRKADQVLKKSDGNRRTRMNNSKLVDANKAGTKDGHQCTLILTEGDSASLLAVAGRAVVDPDRIGVFPLRGKLLNVRDAPVESISKNQEIQNIKKFMGFQHKKHYDDTRSLRYGHLMIMTDQDHDGSHIKGLLINFLEWSFPSLLKISGFLQVFITPIVKVWKGDPRNPKKLLSFFTMPEYEQWKDLPGNRRGWEHKYFKGLGTNKTQEVETYFRDLDRHLKGFSVIKPEEAPLIDLAFSKKKADARKEWLRQFVPGTYLDMRIPEITYDDFVNKELILFSIADNQRSIPSVVDGLKLGQRKVLYTCFRRNLKKDLKVVELAGSVSGLTAYAYGETSLQQTIVGLAQNFVGSNNMNCLEPSGNFGSRLQGGADCASARYIYTRLSPFARKMFQATDEPLLTYNQDDGNDIEPEMYVPVVPLILINGADGIGTGWSSQIPNYSPEDIVENLKRRMAGESKDDMLPMKPWFRGWTGEPEDLGGDRFKFSGRITQTGDNEVEITELPVRMWTQDFKDKLEEIIKAEKTPSFIKDYTEYNTPDKVHFIIKMEDKQMQNSLTKGLEDTFKVTKTMATTNLVAFDAQGRIHKYATVLDILEEFYHVRMNYYAKRKQHMLGEMEKDLKKLNNQARFIQMIVDNKLTVNKKKKVVLVEELRKLKFDPIPKVADARKKDELEPIVNPDEDVEEEQEHAALGANDYDYLLGMAIWSLTQERIDKLLKQIGDLEAEFNALSAASEKELWCRDLDDLLAEWKFQLEDEAKQRKESRRAGRRASAKLRIGGKTGAKRRKDDSDSDGDFAVSKKKKGAAGNSKSKPSSMFDWLGKKERSASVEPSKPASSKLASAFEDKRKAPVNELSLDGIAEEATVSAGATEAGNIKAKVVPKPAAAASKPAAPKKVATKIESDSEGEDMFATIAAEAKSKPSASQTSNGGRAPRRAAAKPVKYAAGSDEDSHASSDGEDLLGDVSNMVKGLPKTSTTAAPATTTTTTTASAKEKTLFSASHAAASRPSSSSSGLASAAKAPRQSRVTALDDEDDDVDETDYRSLVPRGSPQKPAARSARDVKVSDDEDEDSLMVSKPKTAARKPIEKATKGKLQPKKPKAKPATETTKPVTLSPAAKAYAAKQAKLNAPSSKPSAQPRFESASTAAAASKAKPAPAKGKGRPEKGASDDEVDAIADEILSDADEAPKSRPSRRAATTKSRYVVDFSDSESGGSSGGSDAGEGEGSEGSEGSFDDE